MRRAPPPLAALSPASLRLAVVGDVHGQWSAEDNWALLGLKPDLVLFVGDFGNEDVAVVSILSELQDKLPLASIFGNHDACFLSRNFARRGKRPPSIGSIAPGSHPRLGSDARFDALRRQHELLARSNVGWGRADFSEHVLGVPLSVVGGRPLSSGGPSMEKRRAMYADLWGVGSTEASARLIANQIDAAPSGHCVICLA